MSGLDTWIVLVILVANIVAMFCIMGWLPGHIDRSRAATKGKRRLGHEAPLPKPQLRPDGD